MFLQRRSELDRAKKSAAPSAPTPLTLIILLRALAAIAIVWHHYAIYPPLREWAAPAFGNLLDWLQAYARATQVFFVVGGMVMARSLLQHHWTLPSLRVFMTGRYFRLGLPYLAIVALIFPVTIFARGWVPDEVVGHPVSLTQVLAHLFFLQGLLGYEHLSAGFWFVCINFQLSVAFAIVLWLREKPLMRRVDIVGLLGWSISIASLFHFNLNEQWDNWFLYFFPYFYLGIALQRSLARPGWKSEFWAFQLLLLAAMIFEWRWRLGVAATVGVILYFSETRNWRHLPFQLAPLRRLGEISYSLFLVHFPVLLVVSALWVRFDWTSPQQAMLGLLSAFLASIAVAELFYRFVETPSVLAGKRHKHQWKQMGAKAPALATAG